MFRSPLLGPGSFLLQQYRISLFLISIPGESVCWAKWERWDTLCCTESWWATCCSRGNEKGRARYSPPKSRGKSQNELGFILIINHCLTKDYHLRTRPFTIMQGGEKKKVHYRTYGELESHTSAHHKLTKQLFILHQDLVPHAEHYKLVHNTVRS